MKTIKRTLALLICIIMVASLFVACGKDSSQDSGKSVDNSSSTADQKDNATPAKK